MSTTLDLDDDLTGQVRNAMSEPVSSPENSIRKLNVVSLLTDHRLRRMERIGVWMIATVAVGSFSVVVSVFGGLLGASYILGRRLEAIDTLSQRVERLEGTR
jgi:hypothetical protein